MPGDIPYRRTDMDSTIAWMMGSPPTDQPLTERRLSHLRALRGGGTPTPTLSERIAAVVRSIRVGAPAAATATGPALDAACCAA